MATAFDWKIVQLEREVSDGYVFCAHFSVNASNGAYSIGINSSATLDRPSDLIPYEDLTEQIVIDWVKHALGEKNVQIILDDLQKQLDRQHAATKAIGLPWNAG